MRNIPDSCSMEINVSISLSANWYRADVNDCIDSDNFCILCNKYIINWLNHSIIHATTVVIHYKSSAHQTSQRSQTAISSSDLKVLVEPETMHFTKDFNKPKLKMSKTMIVLHRSASSFIHWRSLCWNVEHVRISLTSYNAVIKVQYVPIIAVVDVLCQLSVFNWRTSSQNHPKVPTNTRVLVEQLYLPPDAESHALQHSLNYSWEIGLL
jgi:hypothetical protein